MSLSLKQQLLLVCSSSSEVCVPAEAIFLATVSSSSSDGRLFCVLVDNNPGRLTFSQPNYVSNAVEFSSQLTLHASPGDTAAPPSSAAPPQGTYYRSGDPVLVQYSNGAEGLFSLPSPLNGQLCHDRNPITYLSDQELSCERRWVSLADACSSSSFLNALNYYQAFTLSSPSSSSDVPLTLASYQCLNESGHVMPCDSATPPTPQYNSTLGSCDSVVREVTYIVTHNGTEGIISAAVSVVTGILREPASVLEQKFAVRFSNGQLSGLKRSGNPGYQDGLPVLAGTLDGQSVNISSDNEEWLTVMAGGKDCGRRVSVRFREDIKTSCNYR